MNILVTGGTGVVGEASVTALLRRGHHVRLLSRNAATDAAIWTRGVSPIQGDIQDRELVTHAMEGCDAVVHMAAIVAESPPHATFDAVNVNGTRSVMDGARRAGVPRIIYISSLGAERGRSAYHASKRAGERITSELDTNWTILRPGNIYGGGDMLISRLLQLVRALPIIPTIGDGDLQFQPMWVDDFASALANVVERTDLNRCRLDVSGPDRTSMNDLIVRLERITGRNVNTAHLTDRVALYASKQAARFGLDAPLTEDQLIMLRDGNTVPDGNNALEDLLGAPPTTLAKGLARLADSLPEQPTDTGIGRLRHRHVWARIRGPWRGPEELFHCFLRNFSLITPWYMDLDAEADTPCGPLEGATLTMMLPIRGTVQVRVQRVHATCLTLLTLRGHPLGGVVDFSCASPSPGIVDFDVKVYDRAATLADHLMMSTVGGLVQLAAWRSVVSELIREGGGELVGRIRHRSAILDDHAAAQIDRWVHDMVLQRKRAVINHILSRPAS